MKLGIFSEVAVMIRDNKLSESKMNELLEECDYTPVPFFIEFYIMYCLCSNITFVKKVYTLLHEISSAPKKKLKLDPTNIYALAALLAGAKHKKFPDYKSVTVVNISVIEELLSNFGHKQYDHIMGLEKEGKVTSDMMQILNIICYKLTKKDKQSVISIVNYLFNSKKLSLDKLNYDFNKFSKFDKSDLTWYLWYILFSFSKNNAMMHDLIKYNMHIFCTNLIKKYKEPRLDILYYCFIIICKEKTITQSDVPTRELENKPKKNLDYLNCFTFST
jgi:hypothetical protein